MDMDKIKDELFNLSVFEEHKYNTDLEKQIDKINRYYLRKPQAEAFECAVKCCTAPLKSCTEYDECIESCFIKLIDQRIYAETEFRHFNESFSSCIVACEKESVKMLKKNSEKYHTQDTQEHFDNCARMCLEKHAFLLHQTVQRIIETLQEIYGK